MTSGRASTGLPGVSILTVQGGKIPEFQVQPDPAKLVQTQVTVPNILDAIGRTNMIDSPGMIEENHELILGLVSGLARSAAEIENIVVKTTPAGSPLRIGDIAGVSPSVAPVYTVVTANGKPAVLLNVYRQASGNTVAVANAVHSRDRSDPARTASGRAVAAVLRSIGNRQ